MLRIKQAGYRPVTDTYPDSPVTSPPYPGPDGALQAIREFQEAIYCGRLPDAAVASWICRCLERHTGVFPPREVFGWIAQILEEIEFYRNHPMRSVFGLSRLGKPTDVNASAIVGRHFLLARLYGHTIESAICQTAKAFFKSESTIKKLVECFSLPEELTTFRFRDMCEQSLLQRGVDLPQCPRCLGILPSRQRVTPS